MFFPQNGKNDRKRGDFYPKKLFIQILQIQATLKFAVKSAIKNLLINTHIDIHESFFDDRLIFHVKSIEFTELHERITMEIKQETYSFFVGNMQFVGEEIVLHFDRIQKRITLGNGLQKSRNQCEFFGVKKEFVF